MPARELTWWSTRSTRGWTPSTPVDTDLAVKQWHACCTTRSSISATTVHVLTPEAGLPDMVFAANGAFSVDGVVYGARFKYPQRMAEAVAHRAFYEARPDDWRFVAADRDQRG